MPTYEYKCPAGHVFDKFYSTMNSNRRVKCPTCGKMAERQISGGSGLVFKGSGFYITDYKRAGEKREEREETKPAVEAQPRAEAPGRDEARRARQEEKRLRRQVKAHEVIRAALAEAAGRLEVSLSPSAVELERPRDPAHGDVATNLALTLAKSLKQKPRAVAERLVALVQLPQGLVRKIEIAGPGFINFFLAEAQLAGALETVLEAGERYGRGDAGRGTRVNVEFVSANPTGPLHVGHGRGAALGDGIASLLEWTGHAVTREFYVNDAGAQIDKLARSLWARIQEAVGRAAGIPEE